jgi:hypothetical protein
MTTTKVACGQNSELKKPSIWSKEKTHLSINPKCPWNMGCTPVYGSFQIQKLLCNCVTE